MTYKFKALFFPSCKPAFAL